MNKETEDGVGIHVLDLVHTLPEGSQKSIILYCLNELHLSSEETYKALNGATRVFNAIDVLLCSRSD